MTQYYRPELCGSGPFCTDLAEWAAAAGDAVTVLAGLPHYPGVEVFAGYRDNPPRRETLSGVAVERVRSWLPKRRSAGARILSEGLFFLGGLWALLRRRVRRHDYVFSLCPSILTVALGILACRRHGRHVAIVHDIQSGLAGGLGMVGSRWLLAAMRRCERAVLNRTDLVVVLTREMKDELRWLGVMTSIEVAPIWVDTERIRPTVTTGPVRLLYSGNFGRKQGLEQIVALAVALRQREREPEILLRGSGGEQARLAAMIAAADLRNLRLDALLPAERLGEGLAEGDIHLVPQRPDAADFAVPSKIFNIMAAARPAVVTALPGSPLWRLMEESGAFLCTPPDDAEAFADAVERLADDPALRLALGAAGRRFVERHCAKPQILAALMARVDGLSKRPRQMLVLEPDSEGHPQEWLHHLIQFALMAGGDEIVWFVVAPALYRGLAAEIPAAAQDRLRLLPLDARLAKLCTDPTHSLALRGFARWWALRRYLHRTGATTAQVMSLDLLSLPLALGFGAGQGRLSGVLFRPSVHYRFLDAQTPSRNERRRDLRKDLLYRLMLRNRAVHHVLSLDPYFPTYAEHFYSAGGKVRAIPDPVHPAVAISAAARDFAEIFPASRSVLILFGHLTERKGTLTLLEALARLRPETAAKVAVMLAGRIDPAIRDTVAAAHDHLAARQPRLWLHVEDRRLESGEIEALVARADVVLAPYQRFVGSSGVLLWAARAGKPLLTQRFGLLGPLVEMHSLGLAVEANDPSVLADAIARIVAEGPAQFVDRDAACSFIADHTVDRFAAAIFSAMATG